jgi:hypothetical protein
MHAAVSEKATTAESRESRGEKFAESSELRSKSFNLMSGPVPDAGRPRIIGLKIAKLLGCICSIGETASQHSEWSTGVAPHRHTPAIGR